MTEVCPPLERLQSIRYHYFNASNLESMTDTTPRKSQLLVLARDIVCLAVLVVEDMQELHKELDARIYNAHITG